MIVLYVIIGIVVVLALIGAGMLIIDMLYYKKREKEANEKTHS